MPSPFDESGMTHADGPSSIRAFVGIALSPDLVDRIQELQRHVQANLGREVVRWTRREQLHLTLKFFGNVPGSQIQDLTDALRRASAGIRAFRLSIAGLGCFPSVHRPNVLWVGVEGDLAELATLRRQIDRTTEDFGSHSEDREFRPHLTIGRVKASPAEARGVGEVTQQMQIGNLGDWSVLEFELIQSRLAPQGSSYTGLSTVPLPA